MRNHQPIIVALAGLLALASCDSDKGPCPASEVINVGHRGTGVNSDTNPFPENTIVSFLEGVSEGATMIELDVALSADDVLVVMHDATIDRTTDGTGCVHDFSVAELQLLDAADGTTLAGTGVSVPTLAEALSALDADINIEIKVDDGDCPTGDLKELAQQVVDAMQTDSKERQFVVSSFDADVLSEVQTIDANAYLALLSLVPVDAEVAVQRGFQGLNVFSAVLRKGDVESIRAQQLDVTVWTENDSFLINERLGEGVTAIITDEPDLVETLRQEFCVEMGYAP